MSVQMNELARLVRVESLCGFCRRPWFGLVAYCPYCGRKPSFMTINRELDDRPPGVEILASGQGTLGMPAGEPIPSKNLPAERDRSSPAQLNKTALTLLFKTVVAGVSALLLVWMVVKPLAPRTNEVAPPQLPISTSRIAPPRLGPSTSAAQAPSIPLRADTAAPPRSNRSLCSVANEAAGLCKSQE